MDIYVLIQTYIISAQVVKVICIETFGMPLCLCAVLGKKLRSLLYQNDMSMELVNLACERESIQETVGYLVLSETQSPYIKWVCFDLFPPQSPIFKLTPYIHRNYTYKIHAYA